MTEHEIQVRNGDGSLEFFQNLETAISSSHGKGITKISFTWHGEDMRLIPYDRDEFITYAENVLCLDKELTHMIPFNETIWVNQPMSIVCEFATTGISKVNFFGKTTHWASLPKDVMTTEMLLQKYQ
jgi:hypothetical protein